MTGRRALIAAALLLLGCGQRRRMATLELAISDGADGAPTAARVEVVDAAGGAWVAADALSVPQDCLAGILPGWAWDVTARPAIPNPQTGTTQFYADGMATIPLP